MDEQIAQFTEITGASASQAEFYLQSANGDLETAMSTFYESGGATAGITATTGVPMDEDEDYEHDTDLQAALAGTAGGNDESASAAYSGHALGGQTLGGQAPLGGFSTAASSNTPSTSRPSSRTGGVSIRPTPKKTFGTFATLSGNKDSDDEDDEDEKKKPTSWFAGGEKSGISVVDPNANKNRGDDSDGPNDVVRNILKKAAEGSASRETQAPSRATPAQTLWTGSGNTLGSEDSPSSSVAGPSSSQISHTTQMPGSMPGSSFLPPSLRNLFGSGPPPQDREDLPSDYEEESVTRHLTLWRNGFSVEDGPLLSYADPRNMATLEAIQSGTAPESVLNVRYGQQVELRVAKRTDEDYVPPPKKPAKPFSSSGNRLGSPVPAVSASNTASQVPSILQGNSSAASREAPPPTTFQVDQSKPSTMLQIRLGDGTRQTARFNHDHTVGDIRNMINAGNPGMANRSYVLMTTFPNRDLTDHSQTIKDANLIGSVVIQKWT